MALTLTQVAVTSAATALPVLSLGSVVTLIASAATNVGTSNAVTTSTGFVLPANVPVTLPLLDYIGQSPAALYAITASTATLSVAISS